MASSYFALLLLLVLVCVQCHFATSYGMLHLRNHPHNNKSQHYYHHGGHVIKGYYKGCDLFVGNWVHDESFPLYQSSDCSIIDPEFNCQMYGRPDSDYLKYRWKPLHCELPR